MLARARLQRAPGDDRLVKSAGAASSTASEVRQAAQGLSDQDRQLLAALRLQLELIAELERKLEAVEAAQNAALPPVIRLTDFVDFEPPLAQLAAQVPAELAGPMNARRPELEMYSLAAAEELVKRVGEGLMPAKRIADRMNVALSGDESVAAVVSVNVLPPTRGAPGVAEGRARFAAHNPAGGALPIAIEQRGDRAVNVAVLEQRAAQSAVLVIDAGKLDPEDQRKVEASRDGGGGETGLGQVPPTAIVAVLAPVAMARSSALTETFMAQHPVHFVGSVADTKVEYMQRGAGSASSRPASQRVEIFAPDYQTALAALVARNPEKTLVTHTTRLGRPKPIT